MKTVIRRCIDRINRLRKNMPKASDGKPMEPFYTVEGLTNVLVAPRVGKYSPPLDNREFREFLRKVHQPPPKSSRMFYYKEHYWRTTRFSPGRIEISEDSVTWRAPNVNELKILRALTKGFTNWGASRKALL